jgi:protein-S-isoprenylcysteine O-methyltransferase Ste14
MTMNQARFGLMSIFLASLILQLGAFLAIRSKMWPEDLLNLVLKLLGIYSVQLSVVLAGIFAQPRAGLADPPAGLAWTALLLTTLWNLLLVWRSVSFSVAAQDSVGDLIKYIDTVASASSFLVAGVIAFFFGKGTESSSSTR